MRGWKVLASMTTLAMILSPVGSARSSLAQLSGRWAICGEWRSVQPRFHEFRPEAVAVVHRMWRGSWVVLPTIRVRRSRCGGTG
jgi:hypothetical protein